MIVIWLGLGGDFLTVGGFDRLASVGASECGILPIHIASNDAPAIVDLVAHAPNYGFKVFPHGIE